MKDIKTKNYNVCYWEGCPTYDGDKVYYLLEIQHFIGNKFDRQYNTYVLEANDKALEKVFVGLLESEKFIQRIINSKKMINVKEVIFEHLKEF